MARRTSTKSKRTRCPAAKCTNHGPHPPGCGLFCDWRKFHCVIGQFELSGVSSLTQWRIWRSQANFRVVAVTPVEHGHQRNGLHHPYKEEPTFAYRFFRTKKSFQMERPRSSASPTMIRMAPNERGRSVLDAYPFFCSAGSPLTDCSRTLPFPFV